MQTTFGDGSVEQGVSDEINIAFIGPSMLARVLSKNNKNAFIAGISVGYIGYTNMQQFGSRNAENNRW